MVLWYYVMGVLRVNKRTAEGKTVRASDSNLW